MWHTWFDQILLIINDADKCLYHRFAHDRELSYVDDILIVGADMESIEDSMRFLSSTFKI